MHNMKDQSRIGPLTVESLLINFKLHMVALIILFVTTWVGILFTAAPQLKVPIVDFDEDEKACDAAKLKRQYTTEMGKLLKKGYEEVRIRLRLHHHDIRIIPLV